MAELEAKINECNSKGAEDVLVSQKATKVAGRRRTTANTPAGEKHFVISVFWLMNNSYDYNKTVNKIYIINQNNCCC